MLRSGNTKQKVSKRIWHKDNAFVRLLGSRPGYLGDCLGTYFSYQANYPSYEVTLLPSRVIPLVSRILAQIKHLGEADCGVFLPNVRMKCIPLDYFDQYLVVTIAAKTKKVRATQRETGTQNHLVSVLLNKFGVPLVPLTVDVIHTAYGLYCLPLTTTSLHNLHPPFPPLYARLR